MGMSCTKDRLSSISSQSYGIAPFRSGGQHWCTKDLDSLSDVCIRPIGIVVWCSRCFVVIEQGLVEHLKFCRSQEGSKKGGQMSTAGRTAASCAVEGDEIVLMVTYGLINFCGDFLEGETPTLLQADRFLVRQCKLSFLCPLQVPFKEIELLIS